MLLKKRRRFFEKMIIRNEGKNKKNTDEAISFSLRLFADNFEKGQLLADASAKLYWRLNQSKVLYDET